MADRDYTLNLYTSVLGNKDATSYPITELALGWQRSTRFQGGYWLGTFVVRDEIDILQELFYVHLGSHVEERSSGDTTWEGLIYDMTLNDDPDAPELLVTVAGYVHTLNWPYATAGDITTDADAWISSILTTDCEFVAAQTMSENTLQVRQSSMFSIRGFDEIMRVVAMGDAANNLWRFHLTNGRRAIYEQVNVTVPDYYARGGVIRKRSLDSMWNNITAKYKDEKNARQSLAALPQLDSVGRYGQRDHELVENNVPAAAMTALQALYLKENAWPWSRPIGMSPGAPLYNVIGEDVTENPWRVKPGTCRDMHYPAGGIEQGSALADMRDFIVDEVEAYWDENRGRSILRVKTDLFEEAEALQGYYQMRYSGLDGANGSGEGGQVDTWAGFKPGSRGWAKMTPDEQRQTRWGKEHMR
jgi:hypothetical protein